MCPHGAVTSECEACLSAAEASTLLRTPSPEAPNAPIVDLDDALKPGQRVGRFTVVERVGQGGMGLVVSAFDPALDRRVAIKVLKPQQGGSGASSGGTTRLVREAQAMAQLSHPNVVPVYDVGRLGPDSLFVAMEFVSGATLHDWQRQAKRSWRETLEMYLQAGRGLEAAHRAGIVHRDFKPMNVLVGADGRARVTDFGLARAERSEADSVEALRVEGHLTLDTPITIAGAVLGSPGYMAPEQYVGQPTSQGSDQFSFCVALYEALYGLRPFPGTDLQTLRRLTHADVVPPPPRSSTVPGWVFPLIARGLSTAAASRHPSMTSLLAALSKDPSVTRKRWATIIAAAVLTVGVPVGLWLWPLVRASGCNFETQRRASLWPTGGRDEAERAFVATQLPFAARSWEVVRDALEAWASDWQMERHRACDDTLLRRERSEPQLELRLRCLDRRRVEAETLVATLRRADAEVVTQAPLAVSRLSAIGTCTNVDGLEARAALSPERLLAVDNVEQALAEGRMLTALGHFVDARAKLEPAVEAARATGDRQVLAAALLESGGLARSEEHYREARAQLEEALRVALSTGDERTALHSTALLVSLIGWRLEQPEVALGLMSVGRGLVPRVADATLEALLEEGEGDALWQAGEDERSLAAYRRALPLLEAEQGELGLDVARLHSSVGWLLMERGRLVEARVEFERSKATREAFLGADHPEMAPAYSELGHLAYLLEDGPAAVAAFTRTVRLAERLPGGMGVVRAKENLTRALLLAGDLDAAELSHEQARALIRPDFPEEAKEQFDEVEAQLAMERGQFAAAEQAARRAFDRLETKLGKRHRVAAEVNLLMGRALLGQKKAAQALPFIDESLAIAESRDDLLSDEYVRALHAKSEALLALRQVEPARQTALKAQAAVSQLDGAPVLKAQVRLVLAESCAALGQTEEAKKVAREILQQPSSPRLALVRSRAQALLVER